jgi:hypothetical protein
MVAILSEIGQFFEIVPGTFDIFDLLFYILGTILPVLIFTNSKKYLNNLLENTINNKWFKHPSNR